MKILIVDSDIDHNRVISLHLKKSGFDVVESETGKIGWRSVQSEKPDIVLIDCTLSDSSGSALLYKIRGKKRLRKVAVILFATNSNEDSQVRALDSGADGFMLKPFSPRLLEARVNALIRRLHLIFDNTNLANRGGDGRDLSEGWSVEYGDVRINAESHKLFLKGLRADVSPTEFNIIYFFMHNPHVAFTREKILKEVWGDNIVVEPRTVDQHIRRIRATFKIYGCGNIIVTVRGVGYMFEQLN